MVKDVNYLLKENEQLIKEKNELQNNLSEARLIIEAIKKGNIDAVFVANETGKVLVAESPDQTYRRFIGNMREGVVTIQAEGIVLYANSSFAEMINLPMENVVGAIFFDIISQENKEIFEQILARPLENNTNAELSILNRHGILTHFIVSLSRLQLKDVVAFNLVFTDLTSQKEAEKVLMQMNKELETKIKALALSQMDVSMLNTKLEENISTLRELNIELVKFAHIASHDLQEPLRKIRTFGSILKSDYYHQIDERGQNYIDRMQYSSERMQHMISDILEYSKLAQEDLFKPTDLQLVVGEILNDLDIRIAETGATIVIQNTLPVIDANAAQMRQLFSNIISNALKFSRPGIAPEINITCDIREGKEIKKLYNRMSDEDFCVFYIRDNGIGFKMEYMDRIFTIFQRLNSNSLYNGTGIGLAICKRIVEKHHGLITAESRLGEGSLFTVILPVMQVAHRA